MGIIKRNSQAAAAVALSAGICLAAGTATAQQAGYDGVYAGTQALSEPGADQNYSQCLKGPFKRRLVVRGGEATYVYNPTYQGAAVGKVSAEGDVSATDPAANGGVNLSGKITGDEFAGEVWSLYCTYSVKLKKTPQ